MHDVGCKNRHPHFKLFLWVITYGHMLGYISFSFMLISLVWNSMYPKIVFFNLMFFLFHEKTIQYIIKLNYILHYKLNKHKNILTQYVMPLLFSL